jgi:glucokinase
MSEPVIALDLGGTKLAGAVVDSDWTLLHREQVSTPVTQGPDAVMASLIMMAQRLLAATPRAATIGVATAGMIDHHSGRVIYANDNLPGWTGMAIGERMEAALGLRVLVDNDVNAMGLAEARLGAARGRRAVIALTIGTGIGGALLFEGRLYRGAAGLAGELGHICVHPSGPRCVCGRRGCLEVYAAGPRIAASYAAATAANQTPDLPEVLALARAGDRAARAAFVRAGRLVGQVLAGLVNTLNPDALVVGGGVLAARELLLDPLHRSLLRFALPAPAQNLVLLPAALGDDAGLLGAAQLAAGLA